MLLLLPQQVYERNLIRLVQVRHPHSQLLLHLIVPGEHHREHLVFTHHRQIHPRHYLHLLLRLQLPLTHIRKHPLLLSQQISLEVQVTFHLTLVSLVMHYELLPRFYVVSHEFIRKLFYHTHMLLDVLTNV